MRSILAFVIHTLDTPSQPQGNSFTHARTTRKPNLTTCQGDRGSLGNPTMLTLQSGGLGMVITNVQVSTKSGTPRSETKVFDGYNSDDSWTLEHPTTESGIKKYEAFRRAFQAIKDKQSKQLQRKRETDSNCV